MACKISICRFSCCTTLKNSSQIGESINNNSSDCWGTENPIFPKRLGWIPHLCLAFKFSSKRTLISCFNVSNMLFKCTKMIQLSSPSSLKQVISCLQNCKRKKSWNIKGASKPARDPLKAYICENKRYFIHLTEFQRIRFVLLFIRLHSNPL